jgi:hypothetical protein
VAQGLTEAQADLNALPAPKAPQPAEAAEQAHG